MYGACLLDISNHFRKSNVETGDFYGQNILKVKIKIFILWQDWSQDNISIRVLIQWEKY